MFFNAYEIHFLMNSANQLQIRIQVHNSYLESPKSSGKSRTGYEKSS